MSNSNRIFPSITLNPKTTTTTATAGEVDFASGKMVLNNGSISDPVVTESIAATLTNKVLSGNTASSLINGSGTLNTNSSGTITIPNTTDTLVGKATTDTLTNKTLTTPVINSPTGLVKADVGLGNVDNTSDATKNAAVATLTNKTIDATSNTISNISNTNIAAAAGIALNKLAATTANRALVSDGSGFVSPATTTSTEIGFVNGVTSSIQTQLNTKVPFSTWTTKGDMLAASAASTPVVVPVGSYGQALTANPNATTGVTWTGPVVRVKNFIQYGNFENNATTGWSLAHTTLSNLVPNQVAGSWTSASGNLSFATSSSSPLAGTYSGVLTSSAATVAGDMLVSQAYTIDQEYQGKVLTIKLYYKVTSGASNINMSSTSANTFQIYIYDTTNSIWIQPAGAYAFNQNSGVGFATATFQTASNAGQFQLAIVSTNASAGACAIAFDDITVSSVTAPIGPVVTDFQSFPLVITASISNPTPNAGATKNAYWRRVGDSMEIMVDFYQTSGGSGGNGVYIFNVPVGYTIDTNKAPANSSNINGFSSASVGSGVATNIAGASSTSSMANVIVYNSTGLALVIASAATTQTSVSSTIQPMSNGTLWYAFRARVPIVGWSSNVQMSNDTDTRVIVASAQISSTYAGTNQNPIIFDQVNFDNTGSYNNTTGIFRAPVSGYYRITSTVQAAAAGIPVYAANTTTGKVVYLGYTNTTSIVSSGSATLQANAGDSLGVFSGGTATYNTTCVVQFERITGPSVIAATESVNMAAVNASSQTIPNATFTTLTNWTKDFDSHNAFNATTGVYTVPVSGKYLVTSIVDYNPTGVPTVSAVYQANVSQSGSVSISRLLGSQAVQVGAAVRMSPSGSYVLNCASGDSIVIQAWQNSSASQPLTTVSNCSIERIGN